MITRFRCLPSSNSAIRFKMLRRSSSSTGILGPGGLVDPGADGELHDIAFEQPIRQSHRGVGTYLFRRGFVFDQAQLRSGVNR